MSSSRLAAAAVVTLAAAATAAHADPAAMRGTCDVSALPSGYVEQVSDDDTNALVSLINGWIANPYAAPLIEWKRGVVWARSKVDVAAGPHADTAPAKQRVCGVANRWLRSALREHIAAFADLTCDGNVCCYPGMEYAPNGLVVFHKRIVDGNTVWSLAAWTELYAAALGPNDVAANTKFVTGALKSVASTRCAGEPDGGD